MTYAEVYVSKDVWREALYPIFYSRPVPEDVPVILEARNQAGLRLGISDRKILSGSSKR